MKTFNNLIVLQLAINFANLFIFPFMFMWSIGPIFPSSMVKLRFKSVPTVIPGIAKHSRRHQGPPLRRNLMFECKFIVSSLYYLFLSLFISPILLYPITWSRCMCNVCGYVSGWPGTELPRHCLWCHGTRSRYPESCTIPVPLPRTGFLQTLSVILLQIWTGWKACVNL